MIKRVFLFLVINFAALALGSLFTSSGVPSDWYTQLNKAPWTPPGWVFGFAWTSIMICFSVYMAVAWELVNNRGILIILYLIQWALNVSWNPVFFHWHQVSWGLLIILCLTGLIGYLLFHFRKKLGAHSLWISPYFLWLIVASSLNAYVWIYNSP